MKNIRLIITDTDSLFYEIKTEDVHKDLYEKDKKYFDTSDYPSKSEYYSEENKNVIGKMKDEPVATPIKEVVGLRNKMYSYCLDDTCIKNVKVSQKMWLRNKCHLTITKLFTNGTQHENAWV